MRSETRVHAAQGNIEEKTSPKNPSIWEGMRLREVRKGPDLKREGERERERKGEKEGGKEGKRRERTQREPAQNPLEGKEKNRNRNWSL